MSLAEEKAKIALSSLSPFLKMLEVLEACVEFKFDVTFDDVEYVRQNAIYWRQRLDPLLCRAMDIAAGEAFVEYVHMERPINRFTDPDVHEFVSRQLDIQYCLIPSSDSTCPNIFDLDRE